MLRDAVLARGEPATHVLAEGLQVLEDSDLRDALPEFTAAYMGVTYQFSSAEAQEKFEADPEKYAPIQQGTDVVLLVGESRYSRGSIERAVWFRDRLYLFSNDDSLNTFKREPARFAQER